MGGVYGMRIAVLLKQVPDTWGERTLDPVSGLLDRSASDPVIDECGERALEVALLYQDEHDAEVTVLTMGPDSAADVLRKGLAMGADRAVHVVDDELRGADLVRTATVLAAALEREDLDLVICGNESTDGRGGVIPAMLAERLGIVALTYLNAVDLTADEVRGERATERGTVDAHAALPAVISVTERAPEPRFPSFKGIMRAKKKVLETVSVADLGVAGAPETTASVIVSVTERPAKTGGTRVVDDGTAGEQLAEFLRESRLA
jgi:electron transfer flavoprotein beta subunit